MSGLFDEDELQALDAAIKPRENAALRAPASSVATAVPVPAATPAPAPGPAAPRSTPEAWSKVLQSIPEAFRPALLEGAWRTHDQILEQLQDRAEVIPGMNANSAQTTALSTLTYGSYLPYHLVKPEDLPQAIELVRQDTFAFRKWIMARNPTADRVLVVCDQPDAELIAQALDLQFANCPADYLLCGPGRDVENMLRDYGKSRNWVTSRIASVDYDARGASWETFPGPKLDKLVERVFKELKPDRVFAFEPVRMPATQAVLDAARHRNIPTMYTDAPLATAAKPAP